jgi:hypothetical protein
MLTSVPCPQSAESVHALTPSYFKMWFNVILPFMNNVPNGVFPSHAESDMFSMNFLYGDKQSLLVLTLVQRKIQKKWYKDA